MGLLNETTLRLAARLTEAMLRLEGGQVEYFQDILNEERKRTDAYARTLAADVDGYNTIKLFALLNHHCQKCAEDKNAWHTRPAFCSHQGFLSGCQDPELQ